MHFFESIPHSSSIVNVGDFIHVFSSKTIENILPRLGIFLHGGIVSWSPISLRFVEIHHAISIKNDPPALVVICGNVAFHGLFPPFFLTSLPKMSLVDGNTEREFV